MSSDTLRKETDAFVSFFSAFELPRTIATIVDLSDGAPLLQVLTLVHSEYFRQPNRLSPQLSENWVLRFSALKRLYRLLTQSFSDVLNQFTSSLEVPDLQAMAKDSNVKATLIMCRLTITIAVQCDNNKLIIEKIQGLSETNQHYLMKAIEQVMAKVQASGETTVGEVTMTDDDHYYNIQSDRSRILSEKETLETVYQTLLEEHRALQTSYDDVVSEKDEALARIRQSQREADDNRKSDKADVMMRAEIDRLRADLQKSEDNLAVAESDLDKQTNIAVDLSRKVEELQGKAEEAARLKDQVDEYRHAADKLQKTENVMEKYKKKLQEGVDLRQQLKALENQNADLVDQNASIEEDYRKVAAFKPLMESYKTQIAELETKSATRTKELETVKFELDQTRVKLKIANDERAKDSETLELYQERVRELELVSHQRPSASSSTTKGEVNGSMVPEGESMAVLEDDDNDEGGLGGELDTALTGTTMTDLKLQVRKLKRELEAVRKNEADSSKVLVLENLLEDANRMKARYESDYLAEHREKLVLQSTLEEIRSGKSMGDGAEAAIALRQRLNETVDQLDDLNRRYTELEVKFESQSKELTIIKSDLTLVNKDQLDILASLRESVNEDKAELEADLIRVKTQLKDVQDKNKMQLEQINGLLLEKVGLQGDSIDQRERMLARERDFSNLRRTIAGKDLPEDTKEQLIALHEEVGVLKEQYKDSQEKLHKAKAFIKSQDKLFKEEQAKKGGFGGTFEEAEASYRSQIKVLEEDLVRQQRIVSDQRERYKKEHHLIIGFLHKQGMNNARDLLGSQVQQQGRGGPNSWLGQQRNKLGQQLRR